MKKKNFVLSALFAILFIQTAGVCESTLLWKIENDDRVVYLLGSVHLSRADIYPLDSRIEKAFEEADVVGFELIPDRIDPDKLMEMGRYQDSTLLKDVLSKETYELLKEEFRSLKIPEFVYKKYKPWFAVMTLSTFFYNKYGFVSEYGIENYFLKKCAGKKLIELETLEEQVEALEVSNDVFLNDEFVRMSIQELKNSLSIMDSLLMAWKKGDVDYLDSVINAYRYESAEGELFYAKLLDERNERMASKIESFLEERSNEKYFIIVGAGHLIGKNSVIDLLSRKNKYKIIRF